MKQQLIKLEFKKNKYKYIFLITITFLGFISGIIFANILSYNDYNKIASLLKDYFLDLKNGNQINYLSNFFNILGTNFIYLFLIFIFGLSIIGIILNPFILYFKSLIIGFSIGIIIAVYGFRGIPLAIFFGFPHLLINLIIYILISFYGINLAIKLFKALFLKKQFNFSYIIKKYFKILAFCSVILIITTLYETFFQDFIMKLFTFLIK